MKYKNGDIVQYLANGSIALIDEAADSNVYWCWVGNKNYTLLYDWPDMSPLTLISEL